MARIIGTGTRADYVERAVRGATHVVVDEAALDERERARIAAAWVNPAGEVITVRRVAGDVEAWRFGGEITVTVVALPETSARALEVLLTRCAVSAAANV